MKRIYVRKQNEIAGHVFKCKTSVAKDIVAQLSWTLVLAGILAEADWANCQETIAEKYNIYIAEKNIDGRSKLAKQLPYFSWKTVLTMKANRQY